MALMQGQLVRSRCGRDKGHTFAVLAVEGQMLFLADGHLHKLSSPKGKKRKHVAPTTTVLQGEILASDERLCEAIAVYDAAHPI